MILKEVREPAEFEEIYDDVITPEEIRSEFDINIEDLEQITIEELYSKTPNPDPLDEFDNPPSGEYFILLDKEKNVEFFIDTQGYNYCRYAYKLERSSNSVNESQTAIIDAQQLPIEEETSVVMESDDFKSWMIKENNYFEREDAKKGVTVYQLMISPETNKEYLDSGKVVDEDWAAGNIDVIWQDEVHEFDVPMNSVYLKPAKENQIEEATEVEFNNEDNIKVYNYEVYMKNPETGENNWTISFFNIFAKDKEESRQILKSIPYFDAVILYNGESKATDKDIKAYAEGYDYKEVESSSGEKDSLEEGFEDYDEDYDDEDNVEEVNDTRETKNFKLYFSHEDNLFTIDFLNENSNIYKIIKNSMGKLNNNYIFNLGVDLNQEDLDILIPILEKYKQDPDVEVFLTSLVDLKNPKKALEESESSNEETFSAYVCERCGFIFDVEENNFELKCPMCKNANEDAFEEIAITVNNKDNGFKISSIKVGNEEKIKDPDYLESAEVFIDENK